MKYTVTFAPRARDDYFAMSAYDRAVVRDAINTHLLHQPMLESKSRSKRLREMSKPQYRLRVGEIRVFYDVNGPEVEVLGVVDKAHAEAWLQKWGIHT